MSAVENISPVVTSIVNQAQVSEASHLQARAFVRLAANRISQAGAVARFNAYQVDKAALVARPISIMAMVQEGTPQAEM